MITQQQPAAAAAYHHSVSQALSSSSLNSTASAPSMALCMARPPGCGANAGMLWHARFSESEIILVTPTWQALFLHACGFSDSQMGTLLYMALLGDAAISLVVTICADGYVPCASLASILPFTHCQTPLTQVQREGQACTTPHSPLLEFHPLHAHIHYHTATTQVWPPTHALHWLHTEAARGSRDGLRAWNKLLAACSGNDGAGGRLGSSCLCVLGERGCRALVPLQASHWHHIASPEEGRAYT